MGRFWRPSRNLEHNPVTLKETISQLLRVFPTGRLGPRRRAGMMSRTAELLGLVQLEDSNLKLLEKPSHFPSCRRKIQNTITLPIFEPSWAILSRSVYWQNPQACRKMHICPTQTGRYCICIPMNQVLGVSAMHSWPRCC